MTGIRAKPAAARVATPSTARSEAMPALEKRDGSRKRADEVTRFEQQPGSATTLEAPASERRGNASALRAAESRAQTDSGEAKWKTPPPGVDVVPNTTGKGAWIEKWQSPKTGKWVHNYTLAFMEKRAEKKFVDNRRFAAALGDVRAQVSKDLGRDGSKAQLCALAVALIDQGYFRVGNEESDDNGVYGVTTLEARHVDVRAGGEVQFEYVGKKSVEQHRVVVDKQIAKVLQRLLAKAKPDERLLVHGKDVIDAGDVNRYLDKFDVTAKQFRTFHATRLLHEQLSEQRDVPKEQRAAVVTAAFEHVAALLGHTPAVCQQSYVDPTVVTAYLEGDRDG